MDAQIKINKQYHYVQLLIILLSKNSLIIIQENRQKMQIDNNNFHHHVDLILKQIQQSNFIAFDCQFTGLVTQETNIEGLFPNQQEFYERIKQTALNFNLLQLGLTLFHFQNGQYYPKSYNFYVSASHKKGYREIILSEWESMAFLARNGMDFHRAFKQGIEFNRIFNDDKQQKEQKKQIKQISENQQKTFFSPSDRQIISNIEQMITEESLKINFKTKKIMDFFKSKYDMTFDKPKKNMDKYQYIVKIYHNIQTINETLDSNHNIFSQKKEDITFDQKPHPHLGLQILIKKIIDCKKPLVGHFPNLDIGLIYHSFIAQLPQSYQQFSDKINQLFPYIFDTKVISRRLQNKMKSIKVDLKSLYRACFNKKLLQEYANINYKYVQNYLKEESSHQAGYDSFMTGCALIAMLNYLYNVKMHPFVFANAYAENKILYSRFSGEVSLIGPIYSQRSQQFKKRIIIYSGSKQNQVHEQIAQQLSKFGTLTMHEDHGQIYYYFQENQDITAILNQYKSVKRYEDRNIIRCRKFYK